MEATLEQVKRTANIAGVTMTLKQCIKVNDAPMGKDASYSDILNNIEPTVSAIKSDNGSYIVNVFLYIPAQELKPMGDSVLTGGLVLEENEADEKVLFLEYNGAVNIETEDEKSLTSRSFKVIYDCEEDFQNGFNLYHIQFEYSLSSNIIGAEAIHVSFVDIDPISPRGTVTKVID